MLRVLLCNIRVWSTCIKRSPGAPHCIGLPWPSFAELFQPCRRNLTAIRIPISAGNGSWATASRDGSMSEPPGRRTESPLANSGKETMSTSRRLAKSRALLHRIRSFIPMFGIIKQVSFSGFTRCVSPSSNGIDSPARQVREEAEVE